MHRLPDLKKLEKRAYQTNFTDGIYDIVWGFMFLVISLNPILYRTGFPKPIIYIVELFLVGLFLVLAKQLITVPRLGIVRFGSHRKARAVQILALGIIINVLVLLFILMNSLEVFSLQVISNHINPLIYSLFFFTLFTILASVLSYSTIFLAGILFGSSIFVSEILYSRIGEPLDSLIPFGVSALIILSIGMMRLIQFIRMYPKETMES
ncbi:hypothetical protein JW824_10295 [bacterium]|nr:hypothetical protein [bacterium]RQV94097.1 MAG: hypothetical protein EH221_08330 [bacterium]